MVETTRKENGMSANLGDLPIIQETYAEGRIDSRIESLTAALQVRFGEDARIAVIVEQLVRVDSHQAMSQIIKATSLDEIADARFEALAERH
jgi:citrate lyase gamma subunit